MYVFFIPENPIPRRPVNYIANCSDNHFSDSSAAAPYNRHAFGQASG
jgi:hypothetical protein